MFWLQQPRLRRFRAACEARVPPSAYLSSSSSGGVRRPARPAKSTIAGNEATAVDIPLAVQLPPLECQSSGSPSGRLSVSPSARLSSSSSGGVRIQRGQASSSSSSVFSFPSLSSTTKSSGTARRPPTVHLSPSSSSSSDYIKDPADWTTRPDVLARYNQYKRASVRHSTHKGKYESEREQRTIEKGKRTKTYTPNGLTLESHEYLGPAARQWRGSAKRHANLRDGFLTDYPRAYEDKAAVKNHREQAQDARNSSKTAKRYMREHFVNGGNFQQSDPYESYDRRTGGSQGAGRRIVYEYNK